MGFCGGRENGVTLSGCAVQADWGNRCSGAAFGDPWHKTAWCAPGAATSVPLRRGGGAPSVSWGKADKATRKQKASSSLPSVPPEYRRYASNCWYHTAAITWSPVLSSRQANKTFFSQLTCQLDARRLPFALHRCLLASVPSLCLDAFSEYPMHGFN